MDTATGSAGLGAVLEAAVTLIRQGAMPGPAALGMLARRLDQGAEPAVPGVDLGVYDTLFALEASA